nr:12587_t:CDS:2 [Entrophospora candida]
MSSIIQFVENNGRYNTNHSQSNTYIANTKETRANTARAIANATQAMTIWENIEVGVDDEAESLSVSFSIYDSMQQSDNYKQQNNIESELIDFKTSTKKSNELKEFIDELDKFNERINNDNKFVGFNNLSNEILKTLKIIEKCVTCKGKLIEDDSIYLLINESIVLFKSPINGDEEIEGIVVIEALIKLFLEYSLNPSEEQKEIIRLAETKRQEIITKGLPNEKNHPEAFYTSRSLSQLTQQANSSLAGSNYRDTSAMIWQMRND